MNHIQFLKIGMTLIGVLVGGEALALLIGMHVLSARPNAWISFKNDLLLALDLVTALGLILLVVTNGETFSASAFYFLTCVAIASHGYRLWEYFANAQDKFCINAPLFVINDLKLLGLLIIPALSVAGVI